MVLPLDITAKYRSAMNVCLCCADQNRVPRPVQIAFVIFGNAYGQNGCSWPLSVFWSLALRLIASPFFFFPQLVPSPGHFLLPIKTKKSSVLLLCSYSGGRHHHPSGRSGKNTSWAYPRYLSLPPRHIWPGHLLASFSLTSLISKTNHASNCMFAVISGPFHIILHRLYPMPTNL